MHIHRPWIWSWQFLDLHAHTSDEYCTEMAGISCCVSAALLSGEVSERVVSFGVAKAAAHGSELPSRPATQILYYVKSLSSSIKKQTPSHFHAFCPNRASPPTWWQPHDYPTLILTHNTPPILFFVQHRVRVITPKSIQPHSSSVPLLYFYILMLLISYSFIIKVKKKKKKINWWVGSIHHSCASIYLSTPSMIYWYGPQTYWRTCLMNHSNFDHGFWNQIGWWIMSKKLKNCENSKKKNRKS